MKCDYDHQFQQEKLSQIYPISLKFSQGEIYPKGE